MPRITNKKRLDRAIGLIREKRSVVSKVSSAEEAHDLLFYAYGRLTFEFGAIETTINLASGFVRILDWGSFTVKLVVLEEVVGYDKKSL